MSAPENPSARTPPATPAALAGLPYVPPADRWTKPKMAEFLRQLVAHQRLAVLNSAMARSLDQADRVRQHLAAV